MLSTDCRAFVDELMRRDLSPGMDSLLSTGMLRHIGQGCGVCADYYRAAFNRKYKRNLEGGVDAKC